VGVTLGFKTSLRYFPEQGVGWVVMLNSIPTDQALADIEAELLAFVMQGKTPTTPTPTPTPDSGQLLSLANLTGHYRDAAPDEELFAAVDEFTGGVEIQQRGDELWEGVRQPGLRGLIAGPTWSRLIPTDDHGSFRHENEVIASRYFTTTDGTEALVTPMGYFERTPAWLNPLQRAGLTGALLLLASAAIYAPLMLVKLLSRGSPGKRRWWTCWPPVWVMVAAVGTAVLPALAYVAMSTYSGRLDIPTVNTVAVFILSTLFPIFTALLTASALRIANDGSVAAVYRVHLLLVAAASLSLAVFAWQAHWVALQTWAW
jgi:hypothetical protein